MGRMSWLTHYPTHIPRCKAFDRESGFLTSVRLSPKDYGEKRSYADVESRFTKEIMWLADCVGYLCHRSICFLWVSFSSLSSPYLS